MIKKLMEAKYCFAAWHFDSMVRTESVEMVKILLENNYYLNNQDIEYLINYGTIEMFNLLVDLQKDIDLNKYLACAIAYNKLDIVKLSINLGANPNNEVLLYALIYNINNCEILKLLFDAGFQIDTNDSRYNQHIIDAIMQENFYFTKLLIDLSTKYISFDIFFKEIVKCNCNITPKIKFIIDIDTNIESLGIIKSIISEENSINFIKYFPDRINCIKLLLELKIPDNDTIHKLMDHATKCNY